VFNGLPVTYRIASAARDVSRLSGGAIAVRYTTEDADGRALVTGYAVVRRIGSIVVSANYEVYFRELDNKELDDFLDLTEAAFNRVGETL